jgi:hypothetical protein
LPHQRYFVHSQTVGGVHPFGNLFLQSAAFRGQRVQRGDAAGVFILPER